MFERFEVLLSDLLPRVDSDLLNNMHRVDDMIFRNVLERKICKLKDLWLKSRIIFVFNNNYTIVWLLTLKLQCWLIYTACTNSLRGVFFGAPGNGSCPNLNDNWIDAGSHTSTVYCKPFNYKKFSDKLWICNDFYQTSPKRSSAICG